jgi:hypothetical protein
MMTNIDISSINDWNEVIKKEARGINDADFEEVQDIYSLYILTEKINK